MRMSDPEKPKSYFRRVWNKLKELNKDPDTYDDPLNEPAVLKMDDARKKEAALSERDEVLASKPRGVITHFLTGQNDHEIHLKAGGRPENSKQPEKHSNWPKFNLFRRR
jgi:hypothetical protein